MRCFFLFLSFLCHLKAEALDYYHLSKNALKNQPNPIHLSTELLDSLVAKGFSSLCFFPKEITTSWMDWLKECWHDPKSAGIGFFITPDGHLLTAKHVIQSNPNPITFLGVTGNFTYASLIAIHPTEDLALLKIKESNNIRFPYLRLSSTPEEIGNWVFSLRGRGLITTPENGVIALSLPSIGKLVGYDKSTFIAFSSIAVTRGNSGSPVLNLDGNVIGITKALITHPEMGEVGASAFVSIHQFKDWIEEALRSDGHFHKLE